MGGMGKLLYPGLSYRIVGILMEVYNELGNKYQEKYYQRAISKGLDIVTIKYKREDSVDIKFREENIGKFYVDFVIEDKVILEVKARARLSKTDYHQVRAYLKSKNLELGILANFGVESLYYKRVLNRVS